MPHLEDELETILDLYVISTVEFCDRRLDVHALVGLLAEGLPFWRKGYCDYLGIGESTLTGWIKEGRIPQMAKLATVLFLIHQVLQKEVMRLRADLTEATARDLRIVETSRGYQVCEFEVNLDGEMSGRLLAENIGALQDARLLASGHRAMRLLKEATKVVNDYDDHLEGTSENRKEHVMRSDLSDFENRIAGHALFLTNYAEWQANKGTWGGEARRIAQEAMITRKRIDEMLGELDAIK